MSQLATSTSNQIPLTQNHDSHPELLAATSDVQAEVQPVAEQIRDEHILQASGIMPVVPESIHSGRIDGDEVPQHMLHLDAVQALCNGGRENAHLLSPPEGRGLAESYTAPQESSNPPPPPVEPVPVPHITASAPLSGRNLKAALEASLRLCQEQSQLEHLHSQMALLTTQVSDVGDLSALPMPDTWLQHKQGDVLGCCGALAPQKIADIASSAISFSGRYVAIAAGDEVTIFEVLPAGFVILASRRFAIDNVGVIGTLKFFDDDADSTALILSIGDICFGWDSACASEGQLFLQVRLSPPRHGCIKAVALGQYVLHEYLLLGTTRSSVEVYDLHLYDAHKPALLKVLNIAGDVIGVELVQQASHILVASSISDGFVELRLYQLSGEGGCVASLRPPELAGCGSAAFAFGAVEGGEFAAVAVSQRVVVYDLAELSDASPIRLDLTVMCMDPEQAPPLCWCNRRGWLGVAESGDRAAIYQLEPITKCFVILCFVVTTVRPTSLSWAPAIGLLLIQMGTELRFWLPKVHAELASMRLEEDPRSTAAGDAAWLRQLEMREFMDLPEPVQVQNVGEELSVRGLFDDDSTEVAALVAC
jgi:hypothetical protein